jgi:hypothetical protein
VELQVLTNSGGWLVRSRNERNINFIKPTIILVRARGSSIGGFDYGIEEEIEMAIITFLLALLWQL